MDFVMKQALGGATKDMGKMLGGEDDKDPDAQKKEEERREALRQQEEERKAKHARMEAEREKVRQQIRDKSILDTVLKYLPGPLQDMFKK
ncbi:PREDICTED: complexin-2-like [Fulmarus glacialis]|uniref:complexin-2-like n=1 Tax=Fulmarus glacialis TaxID=30455 RepID=UPI00051BE8E9|nr:PREDICTED: complexin-2-like [Fulmarus glacialis]